MGIDLEALALGALGDAATFDLGPVDDINETIEITFPQPTHIPQARASAQAVSPFQHN